MDERLSLMFRLGWGHDKIQSYFDEWRPKPEKVEKADAGGFVQVGHDVFEVLAPCVLVDRGSAFRVFDNYEGDGKCVLAFLKGMPHEEGELDPEFSYEKFLKPVGLRKDRRFGKIEKEWNTCTSRP